MFVRENQRIDIIIPTYRAHKTLSRTLDSIKAQNILQDLDILVVDDACPEGNYRDTVDFFSQFMKVRTIRLAENSGPGQARQHGIDATKNPYFTCIDADDTFCADNALENLRRVLDEDKNIQCCSGSFVRLDKNGDEGIICKDNMVSMDGKIYRRAFIERYDIRFNHTRANEDTGYNMLVKLLCDNPKEQIKFLPETVCHVHYSASSMTQNNDAQFLWDQGFCGLIDNAIWAIDTARSYRPFSLAITPEIFRGLVTCYIYCSVISERKPIFAAQAWEYAKKFYHKCYKKFYRPSYKNLERHLASMTSDKIFEEAAKIHSATWLKNFVPPMTLAEFLERLSAESYDENQIYEVWAEMNKSPEMKNFIRSNELTGVCPKGYADFLTRGEGIGAP